MPSPACAAKVGQPIGATRDTLDAHGARLTAAAALPGDGFRTQHDSIKWRLTEDLREIAFVCGPRSMASLLLCCLSVRVMSSANGHNVSVKAWFLILWWPFQMLVRTLLMLLTSYSSSRLCIMGPAPIPAELARAVLL
jgi:hypothetical protein